MNPTVEQLTAQFAKLVGERPSAPAAKAATPVVTAAIAPTATAATAPAPTATPAAAATGSAAASAPAAGPIQATSHALKGYDLDVTVAPDQVVAAATILDFDGFGLDAITGVDWLGQNQMEVVYDYFHPITPLRVVVRARVPRAMPELPTISAVFPGANWHEREAHDFFGLVFTGHPNLKPFLLPEDANFHPLRKDYAP